MHELFLYQGFTVSYRVYGNGPEPVLIFHGFGLDGTMFRSFAEATSPMFSMVCVDAIFHGASSLPDDRTHAKPLQYEELIDLHFTLMDKLGHEQFWYAGYSMGGRLALGMARQDISRAKGVLLFAPDGLIRRPWYRGLAHNKLGYKLYDHWVKRPGLFNFVTRSAFKLRFIDERLYTFLMGHSSSYDQRALVRSIWFSLRHIEPELEKVAENITTSDIALWLFVGKFDSIIKPQHANTLRQLLGDRCHYHVLETGHAMMIDRTGKKVLNILKNEKGPKPLN